MKKKIGRPQKYADLLNKLEDDGLYTPATIARLGLSDFLGDETDEKLVMQRIRIAMVRYSNLHEFPDEGDGFVKISGQAPVPGWFGWRWKGKNHNDDCP